jgi:hypothetical protein
MAILWNELPNVIHENKESSAGNLTLANVDQTQNPTAAPTQAHTTQTNPNASSGDPAARNFGYAALALVIIIAAIVLWRLAVCYKRRREQQMMALESARADSVLGDMAMVPQHDDEDDGELL